ncbi:MAG TPA: MCE family protein [Leptolyngbyaceae cyanobacterium M65_K2018_010]|nr:MCE family protein [Leptolyngbyaceae cyanobacterium M65_K2018_010]
MRERAIREGSVGLLILTAVALFGGLVLWLRGFDPRRQSYRVTFVFDNTLGMQEGTAVRFRGVRVGRVLGISPDSNQVKVAAEITQPDLRIPSDSRIQVNQSGLIGDTTIDITPVRSLSGTEMALTPFQPHCNSQVIICDGDQLKGQIGASYESLIRSAEGLANAFADPELIGDLKQTLGNAATFTEQGILLTEELTTLSRQLQTEIGPLLTSANRATDNVGNAAAQFEITGQAINGLIGDNRTTLITTLDHINRSAAHLETILATLEPAIQSGPFLANLEALSADAAAAMADIRTMTSTLNTPENLVMLQQTLDSARSVFQSAYKVLADVDELTGDPVLRNNIRNLINSLNQLVSLTHHLEQSTQLAEALSTPNGTAVERIRFQPLPAAMTDRQGPSLSSGSRWITYNGQHYRVDLGTR